MPKECISPPGGPPPQAPYSPAVAFDNLIFVSGQGPIDAATGEVMRGDFVDEARLTFENVKTLVEASGSSMDKILKVNLYLADMGKFSAVNDVYKEYFGPNFPARTCIQAGALPLGIQVECEVIAHR